MPLVNYIPIATTIFAIFFTIQLYKHWKHNKSEYIMWWMIGVICYGAGTVTESINTLAGYLDTNFKAWYILGAFLGGAPLAQGTVYLLMKRKTAHILAAILTITIIVSSVLVIMSPLHANTDGRLDGKLLEWTYIRYITPFINIYAFIFLVGGAIYSAILYAQSKNTKAACMAISL